MQTDDTVDPAGITAGADGSVASNGLKSWNTNTTAAALATSDQCGSIDVRVPWRTIHHPKPVHTMSTIGTRSTIGTSSTMIKQQSASSKQASSRMLLRELVDPQVHPPVPARPDAPPRPSSRRRLRS